MKSFNESEDYRELYMTHDDNAYEWSKQRGGDYLSKADILFIKELFNKIKLITPSENLKNNKLADKFNILIGSERQQGFVNVNPDLPYKDNPHTIEIEIVNIPPDGVSKFSLKIYISKFKDEWFKVEYHNKYKHKLSSVYKTRVEWVADQMTYRTFICDQLHGLKSLFDKIISEISDDEI